MLLERLLLFLAPHWPLELVPLQPPEGGLCCPGPPVIGWAPIFSNSRMLVFARILTACIKVNDII